jgi:hypothetical protein
MATTAYGATFHYTAGATVTSGQPIYRSKTTGTWFPALNDTAEHADAKGIAITGATVGNVGTAQKSGEVAGLSALTVGGVYCVGATGGALAAGAVASTKFVKPLGVATSATTLRLLRDVASPSSEPIQVA